MEVPRPLHAPFPCHKSDIQERFARFPVVTELTMKISTRPGKGRSADLFTGPGASLVMTQTAQSGKPRNKILVYEIRVGRTDVASRKTKLETDPKIYLCMEVHCTLRCHVRTHLLRLSAEMNPPRITTWHQATSTVTSVSLCKCWRNV